MARSRQLTRRNGNNGMWKRSAMTLAAKGVKYLGKKAGSYAKNYIQKKSRSIKKKTSKNVSREDPQIWSAYSAGGVLKTLTVRPPSKLLKFYKYASNKSTFQTITVKGSIAGEGKQGSDTIGFPSSSNNINQASTVASSQANSAGTLTSLGPVAGALSNKFLLHSVRAICKIVNQGPANTTIRIYHLVSKVTKVTFASPENDWRDGLINEAKYQTTNLTTTPNLSFPGSKPTTSKLFNINWKIINVKTAQMMPGQEITDIWTMVHNKVVDSQYFEAYAQVRGITQAIMLVYSGALGDTVKALSIGNISLAPCKLISSCEQIYETKALSPFQTSTYQDPSPYTTGDANVYVVQDESGVVTDAALAANYA